MTPNTGCRWLCIRNKLPYPPKRIYLYLAFLSYSQSKASYKWTSYTFCFFSDTFYKTYCISWSFGVSTFDLFHPKWYMTMLLSIWPVPRKDSGINTNFYFPKGGPNFESKAIPHVCSVLGCRLLTDKFARRWFLS